LQVEIPSGAYKATIDFSEFELATVISICGVSGKIELDPVGVPALVLRRCVYDKRYSPIPWVVDQK
jgi:hypothetical protein